MTSRPITDYMACKRIRLVRLLYSKNNGCSFSPHRSVLVVGVMSERVLVTFI
jgi:hypothetical protein